MMNPRTYFPRKGRLYDMKRDRSPCSHHQLQAVTHDLNNLGLVKFRNMNWVAAYRLYRP